MDELAHALVARSAETEPLRLGAEATVDLRDRNAPVVEPGEGGEEPGREPWREGEHAVSVPEKPSRVCAEFQVTLCYLDARSCP